MRPPVEEGAALLRVDEPALRGHVPADGRRRDLDEPEFAQRPVVDERLYPLVHLVVAALAGYGEEDAGSPARVDDLLAFEACRGPSASRGRRACRRPPPSARVADASYAASRSPRRPRPCARGARRQSAPPRWRIRPRALGPVTRRRPPRRARRWPGAGSRGVGPAHHAAADQPEPDRHRALLIGVSGPCRPRPHCRRWRPSAFGRSGASSGPKCVGRTGRNLSFCHRATARRIGEAKRRPTRAGLVRRTLAGSPRGCPESSLTVSPRSFDRNSAVSVRLDPGAPRPRASTASPASGPGLRTLASGMAPRGGSPAHRRRDRPRTGGSDWDPRRRP